MTHPPRTKPSPKAVRKGSAIKDTASTEGTAPLVLADLLAMNLPPAVLRVSPWLASGESCLLWGGTGTGKSLVSMTLALGVAGGGKALGWDFPNPCKVRYVDGEQSVRDLQERFRYLSLAIDGHDAEQAAQNLSVSARTLAPGGDFLDLNSKGDVGPFVEGLKRDGVEFVIFDNLSTLVLPRQRGL